MNVWRESKQADYYNKALPTISVWTIFSSVHHQRTRQEGHCVSEGMQAVAMDSLQ